MVSRLLAAAVLVLLVLVTAGSAARKSRTRSTRTSTTTTTTTEAPSAIIPEEWRDPYVYSLFEITLSSIDSKLSKMDKVERALEALTDKMDAIDARLSDTARRSDALLGQLKTVEERLGRIGDADATGRHQSTIADNLQPRILALDEKVSLIGSKLNVLAYQLDTNSIWWSSHNESSSDYAAESSEQKSYVVSAQATPTGNREPWTGTKRSGSESDSSAPTATRTNRQNRQNRQNWLANGSQEADTIRATMSSMDRHLKILIELFSEQMDKMLTIVGDVRQSLLSTSTASSAPTSAGTTTSTTTTTTTSTTPVPSNISAPVKTTGSKLDALYAKMAPLLEVSQKMDQVWDVLVGTKSSVDELVPTQEALLWQTQRQQRAISDIQSDLNVKVKQIIENLNLVMQQQQWEKNHSQEHTTSQPVLEPSPRPSPSHSTPFKRSESVKSVISEQELTSRSTPIGAKSSSSTATTTKNKSDIVDEELTLPTDIMDSEFLLDDPMAGDQVNQTTTTTTTEAPRKVAPATTTATTTPPTTAPTTTGRSGSGTAPTKRSRAPANSSVVFPSVKNKPGFANSSYFYEYTEPQKIRGYSCAELKEQGITKSGIYYLLIRGTSFWYIKVHCDMETAKGGWTVIQRRDDYGEERENFNRDWDDYKSGFGDPEMEFWLGNENIYMLTNAEDYSLRVELEDFEGNVRYAEYSNFKLYSEREQYKLEIGGYTGDAGDSLNDPWYGSNLSPFSTYNQDNDRSSLNCASMLKGGWWWKSCGRGLNGIYLTDPQDLTARQGIVWFRWRGWDYTLKRATMMIRPRYYGLEPPSAPTTTV